MSMNKYRCVLEFTLEDYKKVEVTATIRGYSKEEVTGLISSDVAMYFPEMVSQSIVHPVVTSVRKIAEQV